MIDIKWAIQGLPDVLAKELLRDLTALGDEDRNGSFSLRSLEVLRCHYLVAEYFLSLGIGLSQPGLRSSHLLQSAVARQDISFAGHRKWTGLLDIAATLLFGLVKNHAFHDANKRTALLSCFYQLQCHGRLPGAPQSEFEDLAENIAAGELHNYPRYRKVSRNDDAEIHFISDFLRRHTRKEDKREYRVSYRQLDGILRNFGFRLDDPHDNKVSVYRERRRRLGVIKRREEIVLERVTQIGFRDWGTEVSGRDLRHVRERTRLNAESAVDSQRFFRGVDPIESLIVQYADMLKRLSKK